GSLFHRGRAGGRVRDLRGRSRTRRLTTVGTMGGEQHVRGSAAGGDVAGGAGGRTWGRIAHPPAGLPDGASRDRTGDLLLAKQALSHLSYGPAGGAESTGRSFSLPSTTG